MAVPTKAKEVQRPAAEVGQSRDWLSPTLAAEVAASLARSLRLHKAETIAADVDRKRSTVYRWAAHPEDVPATALPVLAHYDPDPEFLARVAGHLLAQSSAAALARQAAGRAITILEEVAPGRVVMTERRLPK